jgi:hypothetical protein
LKKLEGLSLTAVLAAAAALSGCSPPDPARICVDQIYRRLPDQNCSTPTGGGGGGGGYSGGGRWYYLNSRDVSDEGVPSVGDSVRAGSFSPDAGASYGEAPEGGIARGGFGGHGGGEGGGGEGGGE